MFVSLSLNKACGEQVMLSQAYVSPFSINTRRLRRAASAFLQT